MNADVQFVLRAKYAARFQCKVYFVIMLMEKLNGPYPEFCNKNLLFLVINFQNLSGLKFSCKQCTCPLHHLMHPVGQIFDWLQFIILNHM